MTKYRLWIEETRKTVFEIDAASPEEAVKRCVSDDPKAKKIVGIIQASVKHVDDISAEEPTAEAVKKFDPLDLGHVNN